MMLLIVSPVFTVVYVDNICGKLVLFLVLDESST